MARRQLAAQRALVDRTTVDDHPDVKNAAARVREAYLAYSRAELPAPVSGFVAKRSVQLGQRIAAGTPLMAVVPLDEVWVDANFKEAQLRNMRVGQDVELTADLYGGKLAYFLATTPPFDRSPDVAEMARFEWTLSKAFDSPDVTPITAEPLMALAPDAWETLRFTALPSLQRLTLAFEVPQGWQRREEVEPGNLEVAKAPEPVVWTVWRPEFVSNFRSLEADEAALLEALLAGKPFPELCEAVGAFTGEEQAPARAAGLLRAMVEGGMIAGFSY